MCSKLQLVVNKENYDKRKVLFETDPSNILQKRFHSCTVQFTVMFLVSVYANPKSKENIHKILSKYSGFIQNTFTSNKEYNFLNLYVYRLPNLNYQHNRRI